MLADSEDSLLFAAGAFNGGVAAPDVVDRLAAAFASGVGLSYDDLGPAGAHGVERMNEPWTRRALVPVILPALDGVVGRLTAGALVADIGCGSGIALATLAAAFPASRFEGFDPSSTRPAGPGPAGGRRHRQRRGADRGRRGRARRALLRPDPDPGLHPRHAAPGGGDRGHPQGHQARTAPG